MCSELFRIPYVWGGVPMFGFGVVLAVWAVASLAAAVLLVRRHGWNQETWSYAPLVLLVGAAILFLPRVFPDGWPIRGYGLMVLVGAAAGVGLAVRRARQAGVDHELILSLAFWMFIFGIIGARMFYVIEYWDERFGGRDVLQTLRDVLRFTEGGLVIYGALIGAAAAFVWFTRKHKLPTLAMADLIAPSLAVGLAFGRIGCLLNGCCYGGPTDWPWAVTFPPGSPPYMDEAASGQPYGFRFTADRTNRPVVGAVEPGSVAATAGVATGDVVTGAGGFRVTSIHEAKALLAEAVAAQRPLELVTAAGRTLVLPPVTPAARSRPVHPTQIYSAVNAGLLAWFLWSYYPLGRRDGEVVALLLTIYPVTRFVLEIIRTDESPVFGTGLSISQNRSLMVVIGAAGLWIYLANQPRNRVWGAGTFSANAS